MLLLIMHCAADNIRDLDTIAQMALILLAMAGRRLRYQALTA